MSARPETAGPDAGPEAPYPRRMEGEVIDGFGRGSKELGIPTANLPVSNTETPWIEALPSGVYFGYASLALPASHPNHSPTSLPLPTSTSNSTSTTPSSPDAEFSLFPMVMSIGYNPFYKNTVRTAEVHVLHTFAQDFYKSHMRILILGFIREEKDYDGVEALIKDIMFDCDVARKSLAREAWTPARLPHADAEWLVKPQARTA